MFSWKKKPAPKPSRNRPKTNSGLPGLPGFDIGGQDKDEDLEAELLALTGGVKSAKDEDLNLGDGDLENDLEGELDRILGVKKKKSRKVVESKQLSGDYRSKVLDFQNLEVDDFGDDDDFDENDPDLLDELNEITGEENEDDAEDDEAAHVERIPSQLEIIEERLIIYKEAEVVAKQTGETAKARRFNRGVKTLEKLLIKARSSVVLSPEEIPPEIARPKASGNETKLATTLATNTVTVLDPPAQNTIQGSKEEEPEQLTPKIIQHPTPPIRTTSTHGISFPKPLYFNLPSVDDKSAVSNVSEDKFRVAAIQPLPDNCSMKSAVDMIPEEEQIVAPPQPLPDNRPQKSDTLNALEIRRDEYKKHAVMAKKSNNLPAALEYVKIVKKIDKLIATLESGEYVNSTAIPPPPSLVSKTQVNIQPELPSSSKNRKPQNNQDASLAYVSEVFSIPSTVAEALNQRLNYYRKAQRKFEVAGQVSLAKKYKTIVAAYLNAIKLHEKGGNVPLEKLPTPPGCPPIPIAFKI